MNKEYRVLKGKYDQIDIQIRELHREQREIRNQMKEVCTHEDLIRIDPDPFLMDIGVDDDKTRFKCRDCFEYFSKEEAEMMKPKEGTDSNE